MINLCNNTMIINKRKLYSLLTISLLTLTNIPNYYNDVWATNSNQSVNRQYQDQSQLSISQELKIDLLQEEDFEDKYTHGRRNIKGFQEHHIISNKNKATRNHEIWEKTGMSPNSPENKIVKDGEAEKWTKEQFEIALRDSLEKKRKMLFLGKIDLNNINRHSPSK